MKYCELIIYLILVQKSASDNNNLIEKAVSAANSAFKGVFTSIVWWSDNHNDVTEFIKMFGGCVLVTSIEQNQVSDEAITKYNKNKNFLQTVFFGADVHEFEYFLTLLYKHLVWPIRLIVVWTRPISYTDLSELMKVAWTNDVGDLLVVSIDIEDTEKIMLTTFFPYQDGNCEDFTPVIINPQSNDVFPKKFRNYHQCKIKVTMFQMSPYSRLRMENGTLVSISGIDGNMLLSLLDMLNASMYVSCAVDHGGLGTIINGTATGAFGDLVRKEADVLLPGVFTTAIRYPYGQFTNPHETVNIVWFGPKRRAIGEWRRVLQSFMSPTTPAIFFTAVAFVVATKAVRRFGLNRSYSRDGVVFQTFVIFLGIDVSLEQNANLTNSLFMLWIWFCMIVRIAYQSDLVDGLQKTVLESPLRSFDTAVQHVEGFGGIITVRDFFNGTKYFDKFTVIPQKLIPVNLKAMQEDKNFLLATDERQGLDAAPDVQILDGSITQGPICFGMRPGWPAFPEINEVILRMIETGFPEKILREHSYEWAKAVRTFEDREAKPLNLYTLIGCFYGLGVMYGVCVLILFSEIVYFQMNYTKKFASQ